MACACGPEVEVLAAVGEAGRPRVRVDRDGVDPGLGERDREVRVVRVHPTDVRQQDERDSSSGHRDGVVCGEAGAVRGGQDRPARGLPRHWSGAAGAGAGRSRNTWLQSAPNRRAALVDERLGRRREPVQLVARELRPADDSRVATCSGVRALAIGAPTVGWARSQASDTAVTDESCAAATSSSAASSPALPGWSRYCPAVWARAESTA